MHAAIASLSDSRQRIREHLGCWEELNGDRGAYTLNVTPLLDNNTAAGWVMVVMKRSNTTHFYVFHHGQQADGTAGAQTPKRGGCSYRPLDYILLPPAEDRITDIGEESDDDG